MYEPLPMFLILLQSVDFQYYLIVIPLKNVRESLFCLHYSILLVVLNYSCSLGKKNWRLVRLRMCGVLVRCIHDSIEKTVVSKIQRFLEPNFMLNQTSTFTIYLPRKRSNFLQSNIVQVRVVAIFWCWRKTKSLTPKCGVPN